MLRRSCTYQVCVTFQTSVIFHVIGRWWDAAIRQVGTAIGQVVAEVRKADAEIDRLTTVIQQPVANTRHASTAIRQLRGSYHTLAPWPARTTVNRASHTAFSNAVRHIPN